MENVLEIKNVSKSFGANKVLDGVDMTVRKGEIHALCGENGAGKSTLMNLTSGILQRDSGEILLDGKPINFKSAREAVFAGIAFVHQELALCQHLTVAENMWMWDIPRHAGVIDHKEMYRKTDEILREFNADFTARTRVDTMTVAQQQIAEIAKALSLDAKLIILDEPSSSITDEEVERLFKMCEQVKAKGVGMVYISHRMPEVFTLCDRVTVLRDGKMVMTMNTAEIDQEKVITSMVGRELGDFYPPKSKIENGEELLRVEHFTGKGFEDISFSLKKGKILGFAGLIGSGRTELMQAMCGLGGYKSGDVYLKGEKVNFKTYSQAIANKVCYLTEDRKKNGLFLPMTVGKNVAVSVLREMVSMGLVNDKREGSLARDTIERMRVKISDEKQPVGSLSGGNQQKVLVGKWLAVQPDILIMDEPTRGIDVGAKSEIHHMLRQLCDQGMGIIVISSEMPEVIGVSDEVMVMYEGKYMGTETGERVTEENLMMLASGKKKSVSA